MKCPLSYRLRSIDRIPEPPSTAMVRGTLVHAVLEHVFDRPAGLRTREVALAAVASQWNQLTAENPELADVFSGADGADETDWLASCATLLDQYFQMEDPQYIEPESRELWVEHTLDSGLLLRGIVDRLDIAPDGRIRVVDYKTGKSPNPRFEDKALFQMKFYALVIWRTRGVIPTVLQLMYLGDGKFLRYEPVEADLIATENKVRAIWAAIADALAAGEFRPHKNPLCSWCTFKPLCPEWGGTPPPMPAVKVS